MRSALGYTVPDQTGFGRFVARVMGTKPMAWVGYHLVPRLDRLVSRLTGGRSTLTGWIVPVSPIRLVTTGAKSGERRSTYLFGIPSGEDGLAVIGTSFGQKSTPSWVFNLEANPESQVEYAGITVDALARPALDAEVEPIWEASAEVYPSFPTYRRRLGDREVRLFVLESLA